MKHSSLKLQLKVTKLPNCVDIDGYQAALFLQVFALSKNIFSLTFTELWLCSSLVQLILKTFPWVTFHFCISISQAKILRIKKIAYSHTIRKIQTEGSKIRLSGFGACASLVHWAESPWNEASFWPL